ncbi:MAG: bifunctional 3-(3-hydroxy-phenyl)propionate/3-hydroxycinnamic acid hydroxylase [Henriciella sp.]
MTRPSETDTEIAIIGAGPTGLMLANLLGQSGVRTMILERRDEPFTEPRAIAFDPETLRLFQTVGCYDELAESLELDVPVLYVNASGKTLTHITECPPSYGHSGRGTYYQPELEQALMSGLSRRDSVSLRRGVEVESVTDNGEHVELTVRANSSAAETVSAKYVVDCSGGGSRIRKGLGIGFAGDTYREKWLVIDVQGDDYPGREIRFFCDPNRPAVTLPVSKNRRRWEFLVMPGDDEVELASEESARALMATYGAGNAEYIERSLVYTFHARFADQFRLGRVLLAGDSAHVMPPFAGQGLNSGMRDAANLAWKLAGVIDGRFDDQILGSYDPERRPHIEDMTKLTIRLGQSIMPTNQIKAWFRDRMMLTSWRFASVRRKVNRGDMIPKPSIKGSSLVNWDGAGSVGRMLEQPQITTKSGSQVLLDELIGAGFVALGLNCRVEEALHKEDLRTLTALNARSVSISTAPEHPLDGLDTDGVLRRFAHTEKAILVLRPDRFVIDVFAPDPNAPQLAWLEQAYQLASDPLVEPSQ